MDTFAGGHYLSIQNKANARPPVVVWRVGTTGNAQTNEVALRAAVWCGALGRPSPFIKIPTVVGLEGSALWGVSQPVAVH